MDQPIKSAYPDLSLLLFSSGNYDKGKGEATATAHVLTTSPAARGRRAETSLGACGEKLREETTHTRTEACNKSCLPRAESREVMG